MFEPPVTWPSVGVCLHNCCLMLTSCDLAQCRGVPPYLLSCTWIWDLFQRHNTSTHLAEQYRYIKLIGPWEIWMNFLYVIFKQILVIDGWGISCEIALNMNVTGLNWWSVNIGSGNGLVPSGNKPSPEPILTYIPVAIWHHKATMSWYTENGTCDVICFPVHANSSLLFLQWVKL